MSAENLNAIPLPGDIMQSSHRKIIHVRLSFFPDSRATCLNLNEDHLCLESSGESSDVVGQLAVVAQELDICSIDQDLASSLLLHVLFAAKRSEAPVLGNDDLLAAGELVLGSAESLESGGTV
jgi:hypothetical protein